MESGGARVGLSGRANRGHSRRSRGHCKGLEAEACSQVRTARSMRPAGKQMGWEEMGWYGVGEGEERGVGTPHRAFQAMVRDSHFL